MLRLVSETPPVCTQEDIILLLQELFDPEAPDDRRVLALARFWCGEARVGVREGGRGDIRYTPMQVFKLLVLLELQRIGFETDRAVFCFLNTFGSVDNGAVPRGRHDLSFRPLVRLTIDADALVEVARRHLPHMF